MVDPPPAAVVGPTGSATGAEPSSVLRGLAEDRAADEGRPRASWTGLASALPLADAGVGSLWGQRVLQHLDEWHVKRSQRQGQHASRRHQQDREGTGPLCVKWARRVRRT